MRDATSSQGRSSASYLCLLLLNSLNGPERCPSCLRNNDHLTSYIQVPRFKSTDLAACACFRISFGIFYRPFVSISQESGPKYFPTLPLNINNALRICNKLISRPTDYRQVAKIAHSLSDVFPYSPPRETDAGSSAGLGKRWRPVFVL
jgi:hypothetical protein